MQDNKKARLLTGYIKSSTIYGKLPKREITDRQLTRMNTQNEV